MTIINKWKASASARRAANDQALSDLLEDLLDAPEVMRLDEHMHHMECTRLEHSLHVAYYSFLACRFLGLNERSAARGALLHDLFYHEWREDLHGFFHRRKARRRECTSFHPRVALENAEKLTALTDMERDIILKHMWPWYGIPRYGESLVVTLVDKLCAIMEVLLSFSMAIIRWFIFRRFLRQGVLYNNKS